MRFAAVQSAPQDARAEAISGIAEDSGIIDLPRQYVAHRGGCQRRPMTARRLTRDYGENESRALDCRRKLRSFA